MSITKPLPKILVIVGPTASGKTALAIKLAFRLGSTLLTTSRSGQAKKFSYKGAEIVSADSRQVYRGMDIGTAKPVRSNFQLSISNFQKYSRKSPLYISGGIFHHLIDIKNPDEDYAVAEYKRDAVSAIRGILRRGKLPILVGGTGLYVRAVVDNLDIPKVAADEKLRRRLEKEVRNRGLEYVSKKLVALDPEAAYIVDPKNPRRVVRALEVTLTTGKPFTAQRTRSAPLFDARIIGMKVPPATLRRRIEKRVDEMLRDGLVEEVRGLYKKYGKVKALDAIGYREIIEYLEGKIPLDEAIRQMKLNTWRYARRQMTWFRKSKNIRWTTSASVAQHTNILKYVGML
ncbi:MAG: tRNA (adenosine(37)-N6)-dimethylallyltransferase MiaA [Candidatus Liptonbacteria bacterium]|nr:tRNA (adenosine(37)-N6)-dimethylallyltransferase MiaA [Candidatus Liptonbacteria bacterium]